MVIRECILDLCFLFYCRVILVILVGKESDVRPKLELNFNR